jgi:hypothetical protein
VHAPSVFNTQSLSEQQKAHLVAMGISLYEPVKQIVLANQAWLDDVCKLLNIKVESCVFDAIKPKFDDDTKTLHLPPISYQSEADIKKLIWLNVRQFIS